MITHILTRAAIHIFSGGTAYLIAYFTCRFCERKFKRWWPLVYPAIMAFGLIGLREAFDVDSGDPLIKSVVDWLSWCVGLGLAVWGVYRVRKE